VKSRVLPNALPIHPRTFSMCKELQRTVKLVDFFARLRQANSSSPVWSGLGVLTD
jgi:hypothetical protein